MRERGVPVKRIARHLGRQISSLRRFIARCRGDATSASGSAVSFGSPFSRGLATGWSIPAIAAAELGRALSTVCREVDANGGRKKYRALIADRAACRRALRPLSSTWPRRRAGVLRESYGSPILLRRAHCLNYRQGANHGKCRHATPVQLANPQGTRIADLDEMTRYPPSAHRCPDCLTRTLTEPSAGTTGTKRPEIRSGMSQPINGGGAENHSVVPRMLKAPREDVDSAVRAEIDPTRLSHDNI